MQSGNRSAVTAAALCLLLGAGCVRSEPVTVLDTGYITVERSGTETRVYDRTGNVTYTVTKRRRRSTSGAYRTAETAADTETIKLQTVYGLIVIEDKQGNETYYIK